MRVVVVLPTYNEAENIAEVIERIHAARGGADILVVDDLSPDGTGEIAEKIAARDSRVHVIHRKPPRGRGLAGADGFRWAVRNGYDYIVEMDADLSHDPADIPVLLEAMGRCDVAIGSRFVPGGRSEGRSLGRAVVSLLANGYMRIMLGLPRVRDCTSGYRCFRGSVLAAIDLPSLRSTGPSIVGEVLFRCRRFRILEVPITFRDRAKGASKFNFRAMWENICMAARLRLGSLFGYEEVVRPSAPSGL